MISRGTFRTANNTCKGSSAQPGGTRQTAMPRRAEFFCLWSNMWSRQICQKSKRRKSSKRKDKRTKTSCFSPFFGGDYRTRICDLLRVKIGRGENRVLSAPFGAGYSNKVSGWSLTCPMAPSAHFGVWVSVWVSAKLHRPAPLHENRLKRKLRPPSDGAVPLHQMVGYI